MIQNAVAQQDFSDSLLSGVALQMYHRGMLYASLHLVSKHRCSSHLKLFAFYALLPLFDCISAYGSSRLHTPFAAEKEVILFHTLLLNKGATNAAISRSAFHFLLFNLPYVVVSLKMEMCVAAVLVIDVDAGPQLKISPGRANTKVG